MQYSVHLPTPFIQRYRDRLLPDWSCGVGSVLIALQHSACNLAEQSHRAETQKNLLRETFLQWGQLVASQLRQVGYCTETFDPKTGQPLFSKPGTLWLDDVAVIRVCLGYPTTQVGGCWVIVHPEWGTAVYPSVILSSATPELLRGVANSVTGDGGVIVRELRYRTRSEYHHSCMG